MQGGLNDKIQVLLLDANNFQLYSSHQPFERYPSTSGVIRGMGKYSFKIPHDGVYYIVLDNSQAWLMPRNVTLHLDAILPQSTSASEQIRTALETQYLTLKRVFIFPDFQTSVVHCGVVNAFSNPNITMCVELLEELQARGMTDTVNFVYLHELGHTLMREWGLPLWDNEDAADEFATAFLLMGSQQKIALQAAVVGIARCDHPRRHSQDLDGRPTQPLTSTRTKHHPLGEQRERDRSAMAACVCSEHADAITRRHVA